MYISSKIETSLDTHEPKLTRQGETWFVLSIKNLISIVYKKQTHTTHRLM